MEYRVGRKSIWGWGLICEVMLFCVSVHRDAVGEAV